MKKLAPQEKQGYAANLIVLIFEKYASFLALPKWSNLLDMFPSSSYREKQSSCLEPSLLLVQKNH